MAMNCIGFISKIWCTPHGSNFSFSLRFLCVMHKRMKERLFGVREFCRCALRDYLTDRLAKARKQEKLTQAKFSEKLMMDTRSYASLEHGESLCCTLTFIIYLCFFCRDTDGLIQDLRKIILKVQNDERGAS